MKIVRLDDGTTLLIPEITVKCYICDEPMRADATKYKGEYLFMCPECKEDICDQK